MTSADALALLVTLKLALITSVLLMCVAIPLAWVLHRWQHFLSDFIQAVVAMPLVLPPTVLGFYLLIAFSPQSSFGQLWQSVTGSQLAFSFEALVLASMVYSLPFAVQPLISGFRQFDSEYLVVAKMLAMPKLQIFKQIILPLNLPAVISAFVLAFAHTIGEFGVVLMIGGSIEGQTKVVSISLFERVEALEYHQAHVLSLTLVTISLMLLMLTFWINRKREAL